MSLLLMEVHRSRGEDYEPWEVMVSNTPCKTEKDQAAHY